MKEFYAYHVVTGRPMALGQHIVLDPDHPNGVYHRVMEKLPQAEAILAAPGEFCEKELEHHLSVALRELAMEQVRKEQFPHLPSRLGCLYVSSHPEDSRLWADLFRGWGRKVCQIVKLRIRGSRFVGDANNCFSGSCFREENLRRAERYWRDLPNALAEKPIREILASGDMEVVEILEEF